MSEALYGEHGFYTASGAPAAHFRTAAHASPIWADAILQVLRRVAADVDDDFTVVEVGAGGGELLGAIAVQAPAGWRLVGVDICPRPAELPSRVEWQREAPPEFAGVLLAVEWLDVVPVDVVECADDAVRFVETTADGREQLGAVIDASDRDWLDRWWPLAEVGDRAEIGRSRDEAWAAAVECLHRGVAVAVDYAADPRRDVAGTLTGYRAGRQVAPVPDGSCDITAHVLMAACAAAASADSTRLLSQREALQALGVSADRPSYDGDPQSYLAALSRAGAAAELLDRGGLGAFTWLVQAKGVASPL